MQPLPERDIGVDRHYWHALAGIAAHTQPAFVGASKRGSTSKKPSSIYTPEAQRELADTNSSLSRTLKKLGWFYPPIESAAERFDNEAAC
jgi:hypothetical protein